MNYFYIFKKFLDRFYAIFLFLHFLLNYSLLELEVSSSVLLILQMRSEVENVAKYYS